MTTQAELTRTKSEDAALKGRQDMRALMDEELDAISGGDAGQQGYPENQAGQGALKFY